jgi:protein phosphatase methylesterase 1
VSQKFPDKMIIIVGHSMGGSIAAKATDAILASNLAEKIQGKTILANQNQGCIVIDVVEGTAIEALPFMESILSNRPKAFKSHE